MLIFYGLFIPRNDFQLTLKNQILEKQSGNQIKCIGMNITDIQTKYIFKI